MPERKPARIKRRDAKWPYPAHFTREGSVTFPFNVIDVLHARKITSRRKNSTQKANTLRIQSNFKHF
jgi:hypothetical protein